MGPVEVEIGEHWLAAFDGRVLEFFGGAVERFHVRLLTVSVSVPNKRGVRQVTFEQHQTSAAFPFDPDAFARFQPVLDALQRAGVTVSAPSD